MLALEAQYQTADRPREPAGDDARAQERLAGERKQLDDDILPTPLPYAAGRAGWLAGHETLSRTGGGRHRDAAPRLHRRMKTGEGKTLLSPRC